MADTKTLYVDLTVLKAKAQMLTGLARTLENVESTLKTLAGDSGEFWTGEAHSEFTQNQVKLRKDVKKLKKQVVSGRDKLLNAVSQYEQTESEIGKMVESLSTDDIF